MREGDYLSVFSSTFLPPFFCFMWLLLSLAFCLSTSHLLNFPFCKSPSILWFPWWPKVLSSLFYPLYLLFLSVQSPHSFCSLFTSCFSALPSVFSFPISFQLFQTFGLESSYLHLSPWWLYSISNVACPGILGLLPRNCSFCVFIISESVTPFF